MFSASASSCSAGVKYLFSKLDLDRCFQANPLYVASSGMFVNLSAVMLKLCEPFLDASSSKRDKLDARYVLQGGRLDFRYGAGDDVLFLMCDANFDLLVVSLKESSNNYGVC